MWRAARQRTEPARDWYLCHCERSEPCLKKCAHWFCCPLNKQRDISSQSFCWPALSSGFCRPPRHHSSHRCRSKASAVSFSRDHWYIVFPNSVLLWYSFFSVDPLTVYLLVHRMDIISHVVLCQGSDLDVSSRHNVDRICKTTHNLCDLQLETVLPFFFFLMLSASLAAASAYLHYVGGKRGCF